MTPAHIAAIFGWILVVIVVVGALYTVAAAVVFARFFARALPAPSRSDAVTLLKPLYGVEPRLFDNLATFLKLDHDGPVQLLLGVQRADDAAIAVVDRLRSAYPSAQIDLVIDPTRHGANGKISNLINMTPHARHPILILSDSDIAVRPDYLARLLDALDAPDVGAVTAAYVGRGDAGFWSRFGAAGLDWHLLPGVIFGASRGLATPCMGSTIALRAETLAAIGGFAAFADTLADDYAIGQAILAQEQKVVVPPMLVTHAGIDASFADLWRHEVRWGATILGVEPIGYTAGVIAMPVPIALLATALIPAIGGWALLAALASRLILIAAIRRVSGQWPVPPLLLPVRDCLTFAGFIASFFATSVDWRGSTLRMERDGQVSSGPEISA
ncbi:hopanoid biosynthesis associated glycosyl transferase HpnI [Sphingomonas sp. Leaf357]|uniref:bacteriohopanetetrol glucosamine biosynthesis glycosyltransferase HpnI n=1 Tax=Sphingomonas sp. Leaf357 TaxID=1736350 RepID=UPI0006F71E32|nr:bacteriohopanetetrol glucosamine biosynthesis glycosyltransferase HpnI [Sphingomonas sp. Leaf357]KQS01315.1 hopanoid biosynthesis associated glycosyl transferase HpnI [Sphingomonas sp. Leaf357]